MSYTHAHQVQARSRAVHCKRRSRTDGQQFSDMYRMCLSESSLLSQHKDLDLPQVADPCGMVHVTHFDVYHGVYRAIAAPSDMGPNGSSNQRLNQDYTQRSCSHQQQHKRKQEADKHGQHESLPAISSAQPVRENELHRSSDQHLQKTPRQRYGDRKCENWHEDSDERPLHFDNKEVSDCKRNTKRFPSTYTEQCNHDHPDQKQLLRHRVTSLKEFGRFPSNVNANIGQNINRSKEQKYEINENQALSGEKQFHLSHSQKGISNVSQPPVLSNEKHKHPHQNKKFQPRQSSKRRTTTKKIHQETVEDYTIIPKSIISPTNIISATRSINDSISSKSYITSTFRRTAVRGMFRY
ncbi:hypothetical protein RRG08_039053 [Elysia crispata]|uniref:Uncharacterized protein n=1 Tax=Elysia crispata TaxID=231223 RepID=A0AAE1DT34_9GAST|nr:hypothetical protein RRG08_039053 [Elysia crispata]